MAIRSSFSVVAALATLLILPAVPSAARPDVLAQAQAAPVAEVPNARDAEAFVRGLSDRTVQMIAEPGLNDEQRAERFRKIFASHFDLEGIGRFVLARHWKKANDQERADFLRAFEDLIVLTWSPRFKDYNGEKLAIAAAQPVPHTDHVIVETTIQQTRGAPVALLWELSQGDRGLRVIDLKVEGISMGVTYRDEFRSVLAGSGGNVAELTTILRRKIAEWKAGAAAAGGGR